MPGDGEKVIMFVPAFNEEKLIGNIAGDGVALVRQGILDCFLVINDGSTDATESIARSLGAETITLARNVGKGDAALAGLLEAKNRGATIVIMGDADLLPESHFTADHVLDGMRQLEQEKAGMLIYDVRVKKGTPGQLTGFRLMKMERLDPLFSQFGGKFVLDPRDEAGKMFLDTCRGFGLETALNWWFGFVEPPVVKTLAGALFAREGCVGAKGKQVNTEVVMAEQAINRFERSRGRKMPYFDLRFIANVPAGKARIAAFAH